MAYTVTHTVEAGIERIVYTPRERRFETPILMQHGMWHGAWCWQGWQALLAEWGWESIAISLPGHGGSPTQRPVRWCTLSYYLRFVRAEIERLPRPPVLMGHSMGGALTQWVIKHHPTPLPAYVLVAPWVSHSALLDGTLRFLRLDFWGSLRAFFTLDATPWMRSPQRAAAALISPHATIAPEQLYACLGPESFLVVLQHNPPLWFPAQSASGPLLWLAAERDALIGEWIQRRSAAHYGADYHVIPGAGHNLMHESSAPATAELIHMWLQQQTIP